MTTTQAQSSIESWFAVDGVRLLSPTYGTITRMFDLLEKAGLGGNLTTDALIAAHALESGGRVFTNDMDFARFPEVICENPLSAS